MAVHEWRSMSWPAFRALPADKVVAVLPLGALEAHGPHLPLGTDIIIAEAMARAGAERLSRRGFEAVLLPPLPVAPAPFASSFAGTIDTAPAATTALVSGIAQSGARHGVRATVVANAHHDPAHVRAIRDAARMVQVDGSATIVFPDLTRRRWAARLTEEFQSGACHAGRYEGSIVLAREPQLVDVSLLPTLAANPRSLVDAIARGDCTFADAGGPEAYFGWPAAATAEEGLEIIDRLGAIIEEAVVEALSGDDATVAREMSDAAETRFRVVNPTSLGRPRGFSHGIVAPAGWHLLSVAGQTAADEHGEVSAPAFPAQFAVSLRKVLDVVRGAGGEAAHIVRMTVYVTDLEAYRASRAPLGDIWSRQMGRHYPAMALVGVTGLVDRGATVEIQADAMLPPHGSGAASAVDR